MYQPIFGGTGIMWVQALLLKWYFITHCCQQHVTMKRHKY